MLLGPRSVYLDHNATTPVAPDVQKAMTDVLQHSFGNPSSLHTLGRKARGLVETARASVAKRLGCPSKNILFTSGGTEGNNAVIKGVFLDARIRNGFAGHIVTSSIEHDSILGAAAQVEQLGGSVTYVPAQRDGMIRVADVEAALRDDTVLISIMHANNETGAIQPIAEIAALAKKRGIVMHTDAVQSFGKIPFTVDEFDLRHGNHIVCGGLSIGKPRSSRGKSRLWRILGVARAISGPFGTIAGRNIGRENEVGFRGPRRMSTRSVAALFT